MKHKESEAKLHKQEEDEKMNIVTLKKSEAIERQKLLLAKKFEAADEK